MFMDRALSPSEVLSLESNTQWMTDGDEYVEVATGGSVGSGSATAASAFPSSGGLRCGGEVEVGFSNPLGGMICGTDTLVKLAKGIYFSPTRQRISSSQTSTTKGAAMVPAITVCNQNLG